MPGSSVAASSERNRSPASGSTAVGWSTDRAGLTWPQSSRQVSGLRPRIRAGESVTDRASLVRGIPASASVVPRAWGDLESIRSSAHWQRMEREDETGDKNSRGALVDRYRVGDAVRAGNVGRALPGPARGSGRHEGERVGTAGPGKLTELTVEGVGSRSVGYDGAIGRFTVSVLRDSLIAGCRERPGPRVPATAAPPPREDLQVVNSAGEPRISRRSLGEPADCPSRRPSRSARPPP